MLTKNELLELLHKDVVPALGCTEPVCVALCAATASAELTDPIVRIEVEVSPGLYKNGMSAGIPNCEHVGLQYAAALGAFLKNPNKRMELFEDITPDVLNEVDELCNNDGVIVQINSEESGIFSKCTVWTAAEQATCIIKNAHTNIVFLQKNNETILDCRGGQRLKQDDILVEKLKAMTIAQMRNLVDTVSEDELLFLLDGVVMNETLAAYSKSNKIGVGLADSMRTGAGQKLLSNDIMSRIMVKVTSAAESRLDGCSMPTMSSSGAGTKGLVVILPVNEMADELQVSVLKCVRALALAHLVNRYINAQIGKLSPMCACVLASATAASVGMTYLLEGTNEELGYAVRNMTGTVTGMICDGGKVGCALKVASGSVAAFMSTMAAINEAPLRVSDGICAETPEDCIRNMARIGQEGMNRVDATILDIMREK